MEPAEVANLLKAVLRRPIAYHRAFAEIAGKVSAGLMLSQAWYWTPKTDDDEGWFYKTRDEWTEETGMTRTEQETARRRLVERGLLEEKLAGMPGKLHYRVNVERLVSLLVENPPTGKRKTYQQAGKVPASTEAGNPPALYKGSESTQETTSETTTENVIDKILKSNSEINEATKRLFALWQDIFSTVPTVVTSEWKLTDERKKHIGARFRSDLHWTERQLQEAMRGMRITPHNLGDNQTGTLYIDPNTCFCNDTRVDKYRQIWLTHVRELEKREADEAARKKQTANRNGHGARPVNLPADLQPAAELWNECLARIKSKVKGESFDTWFASVVCEGTKSDADALVLWLRVPNQVVRDWLKVNYANLLDETFSEVFKTRVSVTWILSPEPSNGKESPNGFSTNRSESETRPIIEGAQVEG